jgi:hypothetical protein
MPLGEARTDEPTTQRLATGGNADAPARPQAGEPAERALIAEGAGSVVAAHGAVAGAAVLIRGARKPPRLSTHIVPRRTGPRSAVTQFLSAMVVVVAFVSAVALTTPLGSATGLTSPFKVYANAVPFIPTPTPTPTPVPQSGGLPAFSSNPGTQAIMNEISAVFGLYAQGALNVARCESGYDPNAWNPYAIGNSHASGVFQILYPSTWNGTGYAAYSPFNADANIHAAYQMFQRDGYSWREWACQP